MRKRESTGTGTHPEPSEPGRRRGLAVEREASLRQRLVARDEQALVELVELATPWLLSVAQTMLQDRDEAEEVVMQTFRIVWEH